MVQFFSILGFLICMSLAILFIFKMDNDQA